MKILLIGATGFVGSAILNEALERGHQVTAILRNPDKLKVKNDVLTTVQGDVMNVDALAEQIKGSDAVISAYNAGWSNPNLYQEFMKGSEAIQEAVTKSGVKRLIVIGGAGSLFVAPNLQLLDTPDFPEVYKAGASAARDYLNILQKDNLLDWTFLSPAIEMHAGTSGLRLGSYRSGTDNPVFDVENKSTISVEDIAVACIDELETPKNIRKRFTVAY